MAAGKEIRGKIKSVENTKKITKAMEMVAASKMRKAQERMRAARPYSEKIRNIAANLGKSNPEYVHPFMRTNNAKALGVIVVTTAEKPRNMSESTIGAATIAGPSDQAEMVVATIAAKECSSSERPVGNNAEATTTGTKGNGQNGPLAPPA